MYERDECYYTSSYPGYQSMQATYDEGYLQATLVLYTDTKCKEGRTERDFETEYRLEYKFIIAGAPFFCNHQFFRKTDKK